MSIKGCKVPVPHKVTHFLLFPFYLLKPESSRCSPRPKHMTSLCRKDFRLLKSSRPCGVDLEVSGRCKRVILVEWNMALHIFDLMWVISRACSSVQENKKSTYEDQWGNVYYIIAAITSSCSKEAAASRWNAGGWKRSLSSSHQNKMDRWCLNYVWEMVHSKGRHHLKKFRTTINLTWNDDVQLCVHSKVSKGSCSMLHSVLVHVPIYKILF